MHGPLKPFFFAAGVPAAVTVLLAPWAPIGGMFRQLLTLGPDVQLAALAMCGVLTLFVVALALQLAFPRVLAVAYTTSKEGISQPLFWVCISVGSAALLFFIWVPYNTFGEDLKMVKMQGLELLAPLAILLAVATASVSVAQEVEGRTALTVLSKPIGRRQFVIGKFLGVVVPVLLMFAILGYVFLCSLSYKTVFEAQENGQAESLSSIDCRVAVMSVLPGLVLRLMEVTLLAAVSVAISTRLPMLSNMAICFGLYMIGHLMPMLVQSSAGEFEVVQFMGQLMATVFPVLENYDVQAGISSDQSVPLVYLAMAGLYCLIYCTFSLLGALFLFEDRDLA
jgi:ABC-type transport system involved in multi-copper enzyme maturation permease subunit